MDDESGTGRTEGPSGPGGWEGRVRQVGPSLWSGWRQATGKDRAAFAITPQGWPGLALTDGDGRTRSAFSLDADGSPRLTLLDGDGVTRAALRLEWSGVARLALADRDGTGRLWLEARPDGWARVAFGDRQRSYAALMVSADGAPRLLLADTAGKLVFQAP